MPPGGSSACREHRESTRERCARPAAVPLGAPWQNRWWAPAWTSRSLSPRCAAECELHTALSMRCAPGTWFGCTQGRLRRSAGEDPAIAGHRGNELPRSLSHFLRCVSLLTVRSRRAGTIRRRLPNRSPALPSPTGHPPEWFGCVVSRVVAICMRFAVVCRSRQFLRTAGHQPTVRLAMGGERIGRVGAGGGPIGALAGRTPSIPIRSRARSRMTPAPRPRPPRSAGASTLHPFARAGERPTCAGRGGLPTAGRGRAPVERPECRPPAAQCASRERMASTDTLGAHHL